MIKVQCRNGFKESCCHGKSLVTDAAQAVEKLQKKSYTAQEMREMEAIVASGDIGSMTRERVALMLKQAAEMRGQTLWRSR